MKAKERNIYLIKTILIPLVIFIALGLIGFYAPDFIKVENFNILGVEFWFEKTIHILIIKIVSISILIIIALIKLRDKNKNEVFLNGNIYGNIPYFLYKLAKIFGYKKIDLKLIPIPLIFRIVINDDFEIIDSYKNKESTSINVKSDYSKFNNVRDSKECNLVIADTYEIDLKQIPRNKRSYNTIIINRDRKNDVIERIYSEEFVLEVGRAINRIKNKNLKINLYMTTNIWNTQKIICDYFKVAGRDKYKIEVFQQNLEKNMFEKAGIISVEG